MKNYFSYPWALLYGLYFYLLFQGMYAWRFGHLNTDVSLLGISIIVVGMVSVFLLLFFMRHLARRKFLLLVPFLLALPFAYVGALGGGLLGVLGILIFGITPFLIALPAGYFVIKRLNKNAEPNSVAQ